MINARPALGLLLLLLLLHVTLMSTAASLELQQQQQLSNQQQQQLSNKLQQDANKQQQRLANQAHHRQLTAVCPKPPNTNVVFCGTTCKRCATNDLHATPICKQGACSWKCDKGYLLQTKCDQNGKTCMPKACVRPPPPCPPGMTRKSTSGPCRVCGKGTYKIKAGNGPCTACPAGTFTVGRLAQAHDQPADCLPGGLIPTGNLTSTTSSQSVLDFDELLDWATNNTGGRGNGGRGGGGSGRGRGRACLVSCTGGFSEDARALAHVAGSPMVYASNDVNVLRSGVSRVSRVRNQGSCGTCVNHCLVSAVEAAVATARSIDAAGVSSVSHVMGYACAPFFDLEDIRRTCSSGSTFSDALAGMRRVPEVYFTPEACVAAYTPDLAGLDYMQQPSVCRSIRQSCQQGNQWRCTPVLLSQGTWLIQYHIREYGSVMTQLVIGEEFKTFFERNPTGVFSSSGLPSGSDSFSHAVLLVGYNNEQGFWLIKNSWGESWADGGFARVAFGAAGIGHPEQTWGLTCEPADGSSWAQVWPVTPDSTSPGCFLYTAVAKDHISGIATHFNDDINQFIERNVKRGVIPVNISMSDDGSPVYQPFMSMDWTGTTFKVCGLQDGNIDRSLAAVGPTGTGTPFLLRCPVGSFILSWKGTSYGNYISGLAASCSDGTELPLAGDYGAGIVYQAQPTSKQGFTGVRVLVDSGAVINLRFIFADPPGQLSVQYGSISAGSGRLLACGDMERAAGFIGTAGPVRQEADAPVVLRSLGLICRNLGMPSSVTAFGEYQIGPPEPSEATGTAFDFKCPLGAYIATFSGSAEAFRIISLSATCSDGTALGPAGVPDVASTSADLFTEPKPDAVGAGQGFRVVVGRSSQRVGVDGLCFVLASNGAATDCHGAILDSTLGQFILSCNTGDRVAGFFGVEDVTGSAGGGKLMVLASLGVICRAM